MTKRVTVSLPDDVAAYLDGAINASAVVADALRAHMDRATATEAMLRAVGFEITDAGRQRVRDRLSGLGPSS
jgi:Arc/MetJ-type ribon-helix-helix transcriptional regulator